ncbi:MAG: hypothetical protein HY260_07415 [Chloroflexi bacterium]|nr:hypothetical protein [Chloroflexota bacterium]
MKSNRTTLVGILVLVAAVAIGQAVTFGVARNSWSAFIARLPVIVSMIAFWGPICAVFAAVFIYSTLRLLGFESLEEIRKESVEQNNPTPAIVFVGTLIASFLFLMLVIRP